MTSVDHPVSAIAGRAVPAPGGLARRSLISAKEWGGLAMTLALVCGAESVAGVYGKQVLISFLINAILVMSYRLITTMGGWSFAHVTFAGLGAYAMALMMTPPVSTSFWEAIVVGTGFAGVAALLLAYPALRTRHYNFFLSTFAASAAIQQSFIQFSSITGGTNGIAFIPRPAPIAMVDFSTTAGYFVLVLCITALVAVGLLALDRSRIGRTIKAVAANEQLSESLGVYTWGYRTFAFVVGSAIAGGAGVLLGDFNGIVSPSDFGASFMFKIVAAAIVGGTTTFIGPILGLVYLTILEETFRSTAEYIPLLWGVSVIAAMLLTGGGLEIVLLRALRFRRVTAASSSRA